MFSCCIPCNGTIAMRLLLFSPRPPPPLQTAASAGLDDLLTRGIWRSSPAESHLIASPSNGNNFKPTSQIIRHFSLRTWFWNKSSSQQTHLHLTTLEMHREMNRGGPLLNNSVSCLRTHRTMKVGQPVVQNQKDRKSKMWYFPPLPIKWNFTRLSIKMGESR